jgi:hypothetical protein
MIGRAILDSIRFGIPWPGIGTTRRMVRIHVLEIETNGKIMNGGGVDGEIFVVDQDFQVGCQYGGLDTGFGLVVWWYHSDSGTVAL